MAPKTPDRPKPRAYPAAVEAAEGSHIVPVTHRHKVAVVQQSNGAEERQDKMSGLEDELLEKSLETMRHSLDFASIPFGEEEMPPDFRERFGAQAETVFRTMKAAQMPTKDAPIGLILAQRTAAAIIKARSSEKQKPAGLNIAVQVVLNQPVYEEKDIE